MPVRNRLRALGRWMRLRVVSLSLAAAAALALTTWSALAQDESVAAAAGSDPPATSIAPASAPVAGVATISSGGQPAAVAGTRNASASERPARRQEAFSVAWQRTLTTPDGRTHRLVESRRDQRADGSFKLRHTFYGSDGSPAGEQTFFGITGLGYFRSDDATRTLVFTTPMMDDAAEDVEAYLRAQPQYDREEDVRGQRTLVSRTAAEDGTAYTEEYRAPALGGLLLKRVEVSARGQEVLEPIEITRGEPPPGLFTELASYVVDYTYVERKILEAERRKDTAVVRLLQHALRRARQLRPDGR